MGAPDLSRLTPDVRVSLNGQALDVGTQGALVRVEVDLDVDLFGEARLHFADPRLELMNGTRFSAGAAVKVELGFQRKLQQVFEGEVVALEPQFRRDQPPALTVVCLDALHRLALSQMTRAMNDVDDQELATGIAREHGLEVEAPSGSRGHSLQANTTDAAFLRRLAQKQGHHLRIEGKKLILGPPPRRDGLTLRPGEGLHKLRVCIKAAGQISEVSVHGWDAQNRREIVGRARAEGESGQGSREHGEGTVSFAGHEVTPQDPATAEAMARGRMRKLAEGFVTARGEMTGDAGATPGAELKLEKVGEQVDGTYRIEHATHTFDKHGYRVAFKAVRTAKKKPQPVRAQPPPERQPRLSNPVWTTSDHGHGEVAGLQVDTVDLEGRPVFFVVEHELEPGQWERLAVVRSVAGRQHATASVPLEHPEIRGWNNLAAPHPETVRGDRNLRFHARLSHPGPEQRSEQWVHHRFIDEHTQRPIEGMAFRVFDAAGTQVAQGTTNADGWASAQVRRAGAHRFEYDLPGTAS